MRRSPRRLPIAIRGPRSPKWPSISTAPPSSFWLPASLDCGRSLVKITALETIRVDELQNLIWLKVRTDEGLVGLGETYFMPKTVEAYVHEIVAPKVLGRDPLAIERIAKDLNGYLGFRSTGAEVRGNSALDIALWDLFGKATGQPIAQLLGGFSRQSVRTYNT